MDQNKSLFKKKLAIIISIAVSLFLLTVFLLIIGMFMNNLKQQEMLKTTDKFINPNYSQTRTVREKASY